MCNTPTSASGNGPSRASNLAQVVKYTVRVSDLQAAEPMHARRVSGPGGAHVCMLSDSSHASHSPVLGKSRRFDAILLHSVAEHGKWIY